MTDIGGATPTTTYRRAFASLSKPEWEARTRAAVAARALDSIVGAAAAAAAAAVPSTRPAVPAAASASVAPAPAPQTAPIPGPGAAALAAALAKSSAPAQGVKSATTTFFQGGSLDAAFPGARSAFGQWQAETYFAQPDVKAAARSTFAVVRTVKYSAGGARLR